MNSGHIIELLDARGYRRLSDADRERVEVHSAICADCSDALRAVRFSESMLAARSEVAVAAPPPFFETRVLAALKDRMAERSPFWSFRRWWQASYGMVGAMLLMTTFFGVLSLIAPTSEPQPEVTNYSLYSAEGDVINQRSVRDMTREQMLEVIYTDRKEQGKR